MHNERPNRRAKPARAKPENSGERIAKVMARAGLCSRRDAEAWIAEGRVAVNGKPLTSPAVKVGPQDEVRVDGQPLAQRQRTRLFLFHKPRGLVTTNKDPQGRQTIFDYLGERHPDAPRLVSVGRLDINTEGLLLLTNDGGLARILELPATGWLRRYRVRANGTIDQASLDRLANGLTLDGIHYAGIEAKLDRVQGANCWLTIGLREGKNREIKRVLERLGLSVNRLIRLSFGPFQLGELAEGGLEEVRARVLRDQLGPSLLQEAGADLDTPIDVPREAKPERRPGAARPLRPRHSLPEPKKPKGRPQPGPRKHVLALRAEKETRNEGGKSPRHRIERAETADRKGRVVAVERRVAVESKPKEGVRKHSPGARCKNKSAGHPRQRTR
jgi:23S rRNA pseudouridine2605 synthase